MKITKGRLKEIIKEELRRDLQESYHYDDYATEEKDWGGEGDRFVTDQLRLQHPLESPHNLTDDHIEVAVRDAIYDDDYSDSFAAAETLVAGMSNAEAIEEAIGDSVDDLWATWERASQSR